MHSISLTVQCEALEPVGPDGLDATRWIVVHQQDHESQTWVQIGRTDEQSSLQLAGEEDRNLKFEMFISSNLIGLHETSLNQIL